MSIQLCCISVTVQLLHSSCYIDKMLQHCPYIANEVKGGEDSGLTVSMRFFILVTLNINWQYFWANLVIQRIPADVIVILLVWELLVSDVTKSSYWKW